MVYKKGYQEFANVESAVVTKVKGFAFTNTNPDIPDIYKRIWDTSDLIDVPPSENDAFFIATNIIITPNQSRAACSEVY
jgi:P2X purinoceptor 4